MAGNVPAHLMISPFSRRWEIQPDVCPAMDEHRKDAVSTDSGLTPRCQVYDPIAGRRTCVYWYATVRWSCSYDRVDGSVLWTQAEESGKSQVRCGVLCMAQRRNRPPGV